MTRFPNLGPPGSRDLGNLRPSFVDYVERGFRGPSEPLESGRGHDIPDSRLARLRTQEELLAAMKKSFA